VVSHGVFFLFFCYVELFLKCYTFGFILKNYNIIEELNHKKYTLENHIIAMQSLIRKTLNKFSRVI